MHPHRHRAAPSRRRQSHLHLRRPAAHLCRPAMQGHGEALRTRPRRESLLLLGLQAPYLHPRRGELVLSTRGAEGTGERGGSRQSRQEKCREEPRQEQRHQGRHPHLRSHHTAGGGPCQELAGAVSARQPPRILHAVCWILSQLRCRQGTAAQLDAAAVWQPVRRHQEHRRLDVQAPRQLRLLAPLCPRRTIQTHPRRQGREAVAQHPTRTAPKHHHRQDRDARTRHPEHQLLPLDHRRRSHRKLHLLVDGSRRTEDPHQPAGHRAEQRLRETIQSTDRISREPARMEGGRPRLHR